MPKVTALFVVPLSGQRGSGPLAVWLLAAGWAAAARRVLGGAEILTPQGKISPDAARALASRPELKSSDSRRQSTPMMLARTAAKDILQVRIAQRFLRKCLQDDRLSESPAFVWQHHQPFHRAGFALARKHGCPLVLHVDAPVMWEAKRWGVRRPGWGPIVERLGEIPQMRAASLVTCPSDEVAEELYIRGVSRERVMVTPGGVDLDVFNPDVIANAVREQHNLEGKFVVGWIGSFRKFHGVETALEGFAQFQASCPNSALLMVGDGFERINLQSYAQELGLRDTVFTGTISHDMVPKHIAAMDAALVLAPRGQGFHYSPMKLREYMAVGSSVVAARVGEVERILTDGKNALLVPGNDPKALASALCSLHDEPQLRASLSSEAYRLMKHEGSWDRQVERVIERLRVLARAT